MRKYAVKTSAFINSLVKRSKAIKNTFYIFGATLSMVGLNLSLLQLMVFSKMGIIINSAYWYSEFLFFFVSLMLYVLLLYWAPARLLGGNAAANATVRETNYFNTWLCVRNAWFYVGYKRCSVNNAWTAISGIPAAYSTKTLAQKAGEGYAQHERIDL